MARPKTQRERKQPSFSTLKSPKMNSDDTFRNTAPLPPMRDLVVRPHPIMDSHTAPLMNGKPIPARERHKYMSLPSSYARLQPTSAGTRYLGIADILKRAEMTEYAAVLGEAWFVRRRDHRQAWRVVCAIYNAGAAIGPDDICDQVTTIAGNAAGAFFKSMVNTGLIRVAGRKTHNRFSHMVNTYALTDDTSAKVSRLVIDIRRRQNSDADDGSRVSDPAGVREIDADAIYRSQNPRIQAAIGVGADTEGD